MTATAPPIIPEEDVGFRTSAAILATPDDRYLIQLRDGNPEISFPNAFCLFGGRMEAREEPEAGLRRELREELELEAGDISYFSQLVCDAIYFDGTLRQRYYFEVAIEPGIVDNLVLHEGAAIRLMAAEDIAEEAFRFIPYDLAILHLHMLLQRTRKQGNGVEKIR
jgi:8-oxo-dGTP pyrophosphatase MutT (NUDIX family)